LVSQIRLAAAAENSKELIGAAKIGSMKQIFKAFKKNILNVIVQTFYTILKIKIV